MAEDDSVEYNEAAFRHKVSKDDIRWAVTHPLYEHLMTGYANKYLLLGFDRKGTLLEIMYNRIGDESVNVFHAMKARSVFIDLLD